jgi:hypothetical protein
MTTGSKLSIALIAALLSLGLAACGGGDDSGSTATTDAATLDRQGGDQAGDEASQADAANGDASGSGSASAENEGSDESDEDADGSSAGSEDFVPRQHEDSGGGSDQYVVRGGDNSVQEFGTEADAAEREAAAAAVHNFLDARAQEAWGAACSYISSEVRESLETFATKARQAAENQGKSVPEETGCETILAALTNPAVLPELRKEAAAADVRSLRVEGDRAFVLYTDAKDAVVAIPVVKEDGDWKVGSLAGTPIVY